MGAAHGIEGSFVVHEFMAKGLGLKGNDLIVYARIFDFANAGKPYFESKAGSAGFCGISKRAAFSVVSRLKARGLIEEVEPCDEAKRIGSRCYVPAKEPLSALGITFVTDEEAAYTSGDADEEPALLPSVTSEGPSSPRAPRDEEPSSGPLQKLHPMPKTDNSYFK
ncbi:MAG: hypothetical protein Q3X49_02635 [Slackia sp.]|uniref:hypothetical protein n=1 Tax=Slackia sp. TaxID=2049041 RepID=UPI00284EC6AD|nr:hypothetical protein [Slackia sp.]MDR3899984.1 hypothetical protein [Slackia sp.]